MTWLLFGLLSAFLDGCKKLYAKKLTERFDEYVLAFSTSAIIVFCLLPFVIYNRTPEIGAAFGMALLITAVINAVTLVLIMRALRIADVSLIAPLFALSPAFLLLTSPFILGEFPTTAGLLGMLSILGGAYVLNFKEKVTLAPLAALFRERGERLIVVVALLWAVSSNYYKIGMQQSSPIFFIASLNVIITLLLIPFVLRKKRFETIQSHWRELLPLGILSAGTSVSQWVAASMTLVVYALSIKRLSILVAVVGGIVLFKEERSVNKIVASLLVLIGVYLIS